MRKKKAALLISIIIAGLFVTGCSAFERVRGYTDKEYSVVTVEKSSQLEHGAFYVEKNDGTFQRLYIGQTSYAKGRLTDSPSSGRVAWFGKDYDRIPTMQKGERIAYRSSSEFDDNFNIERYEDIGYTIGICGMTESSTGRYKFSTDPDRMQIDIDTSAGQLYQLGEHTATIDRIGDVDLRRGNISRAGTVIGLEHGKTYATEVYIGTEIIRYSFIADVRAFVSSDVSYINSYAYTQGNTIVFSFPDWFQSGYYCVEGYGFVRYISSAREFTEMMDLNIPNIPGVEAGVETGQEEKVEVIRFRTDREEEITIRVTYDAEIVGEYGVGDIPEPTARVVGDSAAYALNPGGERELVTTIRIPAGDYRLEISGLGGRSYKYRLTRKKEGGDG